MLKRFLSLFLALTMCFCLAACGGNEEKPKNDEDKNQVDTTPDDGAENAGDGDIEIGGDITDIPLDDDEDDTTDTPSGGTTDTPSGGTTDTPSGGGTTSLPVAIGSPAVTIAGEPTQAPAEFFENAAFIGDSVTLKLRNYNTANKSLYGATFLCQGSYSVNHAVNNSMKLSYQGNNEITPQDALKACGADKVFILLGMNDIALHGIDKTIENWGKLIANIRSTCPDIDIYIQSGTPIYLEGEVGSLTNKNMDAYNVRLLEFAKENGCYYIDVNTPFRNSNGGLAKVYCSDAYVHFTDTACKLWVDILMKLTVQ